MAIYHSITELVGNTPLLEISNFKKEEHLESNLFAKLEYFNPAGSIKDRIALNMILNAEQEGKLVPSSTIIEPTSGNTGIGLASIGRARGYRVIIVMPETMSVERRRLIAAYGAELVLTEGSKGMKGAIEKANELHKEIPNSYIPGQFDNPINPETHYRTTGVEIYNDLGGKVDILVAGIGTGGSISGIGKYLKEKNPNVKIIGIEPASSPVITKGVSGPHKIQGIGAGFIPNTLNTSIYDEIITIENDDAFTYGKRFARSEGILVGISSGAALKGASIIARREENKGKNIVVILPDNGDRYLSTPLFD